MFETLVPFITDRLTKHHELYSSPCKAQYWEENSAWALRQAGFGSDWKPDENHGVGIDQKSDCGIRISNKSGSVKQDIVEISGSRLTKHKTLEDKLSFLSVKTHDYILCLSTEKEDWDKGIKRYYFIVIESDVLDYHNQKWVETYGKKGRLTDKLNGWKCISEAFSASISVSMSDQVWTKVKLDYCQEIYEITI